MTDRRRGLQVFLAAALGGLTVADNNASLLPVHGTSLNATSDMESSGVHVTSPPPSSRNASYEDTQGVEGAYTCEGCYCRPVYGSQEVQMETVQYSSSYLMDIYAPLGDTRSRRPAVVIIHGGGFTQGSRDGWWQRMYARLLATHGFVAASIDYTLKPPDAKLSQQYMRMVVDEGASAVQFLRDNALKYRVDPSRIAAAGDSAGADIVAAMVVGNFGQSVKMTSGVSISGQLIYRQWGVTPHADEPPFIDFHCPQDALTPYSDAVDTVQRMRGVGARANLVTFPDSTCPQIAGGHDPWQLVFADIDNHFGFLVDTMQLSRTECPKPVTVIV
eukprot:TRINITY_DN92507_c0_g1_i1.p1 TRINITY_DN92507_c0_g1~~TRINITY_DN92507_c0_g1_i1.p1  ORF type:complete len:357 (-),score=33.44 TRINITY_DN92507_c0_g1_i1:182-1174(-)